MNYAVINPATGQLVESYQFHADAEIDASLGGNARAFQDWRRQSLEERAACLRRAAEILRKGLEVYARDMAIEMGKPLAQGRAEVAKSAFVCEHFAENAEAMLQPQRVASDLPENWVSFQPLGPIFAIMPWNFPFWQVFRAAAPLLMAGNTMVLKHAPRVPRSAQAIEQILAQAGFPAGSLVNVFASNEQAANIISDPRIKGVCLTGSAAAGRAVAAQAGRYLKKVVLELGGSDPYIVLEDADLDLAAQKTVFSRMINNGQTCISAKRFIVVEAVREAFTERVVAELQKQVVGDPERDDVSQGPLARDDLRTELHRQVQQSCAEGATVLLGCEEPVGPGSFYPPSLLGNVRPGMTAFDQELFGPVGAIVPARDEAEAIALANQTVYGLGAAIFTRDVERGRTLAAEQIEAGTCVVNDFVRSDPRLPFGGINESGFGRELGAEGIKEFVNVKTVSIA